MRKRKGFCCFIDHKIQNDLPVNEKLNIIHLLVRLEELTVAFSLTVSGNGLVTGRGLAK